MIKNKETFHARLQPYLSPAQQLDIKLAYVLAKFGHRAQLRKELTTDGKPMRYFEHCRRVALILIDEMQISDRDMIISGLLHDSLEDTHDLTAELLEHCFGSDVVSIIKLLSKVPKDGYIERLNTCHNWKILAIKACDRLDNLRSLMIPENKIEFQIKQVKETKEKYLAVFDRLETLCPTSLRSQIKLVVDEIKRLIARYELMIELKNTAALETA